MVDYGKQAVNSIDNIKLGIDGIGIGVASAVSCSGVTKNYRLGVVLADEWPTVVCDPNWLQTNAGAQNSCIQIAGSSQSGFNGTGTCTSSVNSRTEPKNFNYWSVGPVGDANGESYGNGLFAQYNNLPATQKFVGDIYSTKHLSDYYFNYGTNLTYNGGATVNHMNANPKGGQFCNTQAVITAWSVMADNNKTATNTQVAKLGVGGEGNGVASPDYANDMPIGHGHLGAGDGFGNPLGTAIIQQLDNAIAGDWSTVSGVARLMIIIPSTLPSFEGDDMEKFNDTSATKLDDLAAQCIMDEVKVIVIGSGVDIEFTPTNGTPYKPWEKFASDTNGSSEFIDETIGDIGAVAVVHINNLCV